ncbi:MAG TPA: SLBB domain-containing protein [Burkholderiaceae bacterium]|nr:SLBB domain-containing protein [Burkholderiaceae bacterium]
MSSLKLDLANRPRPGASALMRRLSGPTLLTLLLALAPLGSHAQESDKKAAELGPVQLNGDRRQNDGRGTRELDAEKERARARERMSDRERDQEARQTLAPDKLEQYFKDNLSDFERYVQRQQSRLTGEPLVNSVVRRLGSDLMAADTSRESGAIGLPDDYVLGIDDEIELSLWGSVEGQLRLVVDKTGRITIPRVGAVQVAGTKLGELNTTLTQRVARVFKNFQLNANVSRIKTIRVYVTGFVKRPGMQALSGLSTVLGAVMQAGGPAAGGSFRQVELRRKGKTLSQVDLYDLLVKGDKRGDVALLPDDVVHIRPVGEQIAVLGAVNKPAIVELKRGETLQDAIELVGGLAPVADQRKIVIESVEGSDERRIAEVPLAQSGRYALRNGDVVRALASVDLSLPQDRQAKRVRIEGEVLKPGEYVLPANATVEQALKAAGGLSGGAYVFGTELNRESVRIAQQANYDRALRDLETDLTRATSTQKAISADDATAQQVRATNTSRLIDRLRAVRPTGRIVLQLEPTARTLPDLLLEDGDRLLIPPIPSTVGVFGSVFNAGSYLHKPSTSIEDALRLAGGPTRGADTSSTFVIRANGSVISARQSQGGWLSIGNSLAGLQALPGDTIFVPEELNKTTFVQEAKEWTQILYQFGLGAAALKTIKN